MARAVMMPAAAVQATTSKTVHLSARIMGPRIPCARTKSRAHDAAGCSRCTPQSCTDTSTPATTRTRKRQVRRAAGAAGGGGMAAANAADAPARTTSDNAADQLPMRGWSGAAAAAAREREAPGRRRRRGRGSTRRSV